MKKVININFHSRVIPIEETAYDILQQYVENLRRHFAGEEGGDEIVNDIEDRFSELFSERLKKGATCITDEDVNLTIASMGRPEDFDERESNETSAKANTSAADAGQSFDAGNLKSLYRSDNDKILAGVCGGIASYLRLDPSIVRIIYALISLGSFGFGLLVYIILWVVLPAKSLAISARKRLFRNPDQRVMGGVASGLAAYFNIEVWIPRLIFALPLILGLITSIFRHSWFDFDAGPVIFTGGFGGTLFITYIILWIVLPEANTASEKLEMKGKKVDIESIKNTIKGDLEGFKQRAGEMGNEMKQRAHQIGTEIRQASSDLHQNPAYGTKRVGRGIGHAIAVLFRAFFFFIAIIFSFAIIMALFGLIFASTSIMPLRIYFINGFWENFLAWASIILFVIIPVIALLTWLIRRIIGVRAGRNYLGYIFGSLWTIGLICLITFIGLNLAHFGTKAGVGDDIQLSSPSHGKLFIKVRDEKTTIYSDDWMGIKWNRKDAPFYNVTEDSVMLTTVRINITKSTDSSWHVHREKLSRGNSPLIAKDLAGQISFDVVQTDSVLNLARGFSVTPKQQFRNQQVIVVVEIPVGKKVIIDQNVKSFHWFNINRNQDGIGWNFEFTDEWENEIPWESDVEYTMTENGLQPSVPDNKNKTDNKDKKESEPGKGEYRYHKTGDREPEHGDKDDNTDGETGYESISPLSVFAKCF